MAGEYNEANMLSFPINNSMFLLPRNTPESAWLGHIPFAAWLIELLRPSILVELGTHRGASYLAFCQAVQACAAPTRCYAVDTWQGDEHAGEYGDEVFLPLLDYHQRNYADFSRLMRMRFEEAVEYFEDGTVDVLHIDGLHTYEAVKSDFETWQAKLSNRAVVLFHDINVRERGFGVWKYWNEIRERYPAFAFTHTHGLGVLLVGPEQPAELRAMCALDEDNGDAVLCNRLFDQLGKLIVANIDIGTLAREQGRLAGLLQQSEHLASERAQVIEALHAQTARVQEEMQTQAEHFRAELQAKAEQAEVELGRLSTARDEAHARIAELTAIADNVGMLEHLRRELGAKQALLGEREAEIARLNTALREVSIDLERIRNSLSFRLMAPFRAVRRLLT